MDKTCIIIGSEGFLGKHIRHYAQFNGYVVKGCYDIAPSSGSPLYQCVDMTNKDSVDNINVDVDYIFMFAGLTGTYAGFDAYEKYITINEVGLLYLLDCIRNKGSKAKVIFPSTRLVYNGIDKPLKETDEKNPKTIYAINKLACEAILKAYYNTFGIPYTVYRICVPYGNEISGDYSFGTIGFFLNKAKSGSPITLYGGGTQKRTFTHVADICRQILQTATMSQTDGEIYNIGGETYSLYEVADIVNRNYHSVIQSTEWPEKDWLIESGDTYFDDEKIGQLIGNTVLHRLKEIDF